MLGPELTAEPRTQQTLHYSLRGVQTKQAYSNATYSADRLNERSIETEVVNPPISKGMKKPDSFTGVWLNRRDVAALMAITQHTRERQVVGCGCTAVLPADNVIDLVSKTRILFVDEAIFTAALGAPGYFGSELFADITGHETGSDEPWPWPFSGYAPVP